MKYLKRYNLYESLSKYDVNDIFANISDEITYKVTTSGITNYRISRELYYYLDNTWDFNNLSRRELDEEYEDE